MSIKTLIAAARKTQHCLSPEGDGYSAAIEVLESELFPALEDVDEDLSNHADLETRYRDLQRKLESVRDDVRHEQHFNYETAAKFFKKIGDMEALRQILTEKLALAYNDVLANSQNKYAGGFHDGINKALYEMAKLTTDPIETAFGIVGLKTTGSHNAIIMDSRKGDTIIGNLLSRWLNQHKMEVGTRILFINLGPAKPESK